MKDFTVLLCECLWRLVNTFLAVKCIACAKIFVHVEDPCTFLIRLGESLMVSGKEVHEKSTPVVE